MKYLLVLVSLATAIKCPRSVTCEFWTPQTECLKFSQNIVYLNANMCTEKFHFCNFTSITEVYQTSQNNTVVECTPHYREHTSQNIQETAREICQNKNYYQKKRLADGTHLKECEEDADCKLETGETGRCLCTALGGKSFCSLNIGDLSASEAIDLACNSEYEQLLYYLAYKDAYLALVNKQNCFSNLFEYANYESQMAKLTDDTELEVNSSFCLFVALVVLWSF